MSEQSQKVKEVEARVLVDFTVDGVEYKSNTVAKIDTNTADLYPDIFDTSPAAVKYVKSVEKSE